MGKTKDEKTKDGKTTDEKTKHGKTTDGKATDGKNKDGKIKDGKTKDNKADKLFKIRPLNDYINKKLIQFGVFHKHLSVDEEMVPFFGRHTAKMFMKGKPIRYGYKLWVLASDNGYPYKFDTYCGKNSTEQDNEQIGLGHRVVTDLLACVEDPEKHEVYLDNFFTSYKLLIALRNSKFKATETSRENRLAKCPLMPNQGMKKKDRGFYAAQSDKSVVAVKWFDNHCVTVATNFDSLTPLGKAKRWSVANKASVEICQP